MSHEQEVSFADNPPAMRAIESCTTFLPKNDITFVTGEPGSGKTELLKVINKHLIENHKGVYIVGPTGVSALNAGGVTIHSGFKIPIHNNPEDMMKLRPLSVDNKKELRLLEVLMRIDVIVVDEVSMVSAYMMDMIDKRMRQVKDNNLPFGGLKVILFGDLLQLPPVIGFGDQKKAYQKRYNTEWFFGAKCLEGINYNTILLTRNYRQDQDIQYRNVLQSMRKQKNLELIKETLNEHCTGKLPPASLSTLLCSTNKLCDEYNSRELKAIDSPVRSFRGKVEGDFPIKATPVLEYLELKVGCRIIVKRNTYDDEGYLVAANGDIARVDMIGDEQIFCTKLTTDEEFVLEPCTWENIEYQKNEKDVVEPVVIGSFEQFPVKLGYAVTIHSSQGLTLDEAVIDIGNRQFVNGLFYVAMSRVRTFKGIHLKRRVNMSDMEMDNDILDIYRQLEHVENMFSKEREEAE